MDLWFLKIGPRYFYFLSFFRLLGWIRQRGAESNPKALDFGLRLILTEMKSMKKFFSEKLSGGKKRTFAALMRKFALKLENACEKYDKELEDVAAEQLKKKGLTHASIVISKDGSVVATKISDENYGAEIKDERITNSRDEAFKFFKLLTEADTTRKLNSLHKKYPKWMADKDVKKYEELVMSQMVECAPQKK